MGEGRNEGEETTHTHGEDSSGSGWTTTKQAAKVLGVSRRSVQAYVRRGLLEAREEGEGVAKTFYVSIDSLNTLRNRRIGEAGSSGNFAEGSPQNAQTANLADNPGEALRHAIDRLEARTVEATELRVRLELTEQAQSSLEDQLAQERRRREEAERERDELRRRLEAPSEPRDEPETVAETSGRTDAPEEPTEAQEAAWEPEGTKRRSWWRRWFGFE